MDITLDNNKFDLKSFCNEVNQRVKSRIKSTDCEEVANNDSIANHAYNSLLETKTGCGQCPNKSGFSTSNRAADIRDKAHGLLFAIFAKIRQFTEMVFARFIHIWSICQGGGMCCVLPPNCIFDVKPEPPTNNTNSQLQEIPQAQDNGYEKSCPCSICKSFSKSTASTSQNNCDCEEISEIRRSFLADRGKYSDLIKKCMGCPDIDNFRSCG